MKKRYIYTKSTRIVHVLDAKALLPVNPAYVTSVCGATYPKTQIVKEQPENSKPCRFGCFEEHASPDSPNANCLQVVRARKRNP